MEVSLVLGLCWDLFPLHEQSWLWAAGNVPRSVLGDTWRFGLNVDEKITWKGSGRAHGGRGKMPEDIERMGKKLHCSGFEC